MKQTQLMATDNDFLSVTLGGHHAGLLKEVPLSHL